MALIFHDKIDTITSVSKNIYLYVKEEFMSTHTSQYGTEKNDNSQHQPQTVVTPNSQHAVSESLSHNEYQDQTELGTQQLENPVTRNAAQVPHLNDDAVDKNLVMPQTMKECGSYKKWTESQWAEFKKLVNIGTSGEEFMKMLAFNRRKDLEFVFYELSKREKKVYEPNWQIDVDNGEHALPELKFSKNGLHISNTRLKRHGLEISKNTFVTMKVIQPNKIELTVYPT